MNACLSTLLRQIGESHKVPPKEVPRFFGRRSLAIDVAVNLPFILLYAFLAGLLVGGLRSRYPPEDGWTVALALILLSRWFSASWECYWVNSGRHWRKISGLAPGI